MKITRGAAVPVDLIFPRRCPVCGEIVSPEGALICAGCLRRLSFVRQPFCKKCGKEISDPVGEYCYDCRKRRHSFEAGVALLNYNQAAQRSMAAVKYKNRREYLDFYSQAMVRRYGRWLSRIQPEALVPVPVHKARRRQRGFNQAEELADRISALTGIPVMPGLLIRVRKTLPQKALNPSERLKNLRMAFALSPEWTQEAQKLPGTVVLTDDIYTTGSTVEACSRILTAAGVSHVYFMAVCIGNGR